jgi:hypothetical protein
MSIDWNKRDRVPLTAESMLHNMLGLFYGLVKDKEVRHDIDILCETLERVIGLKKSVIKKTPVGHDERYFIACHKQLYSVHTDLDYPYGVGPEEMGMIKSVTSKLRERETSVDDYLGWVFSVFLKDEFNNKIPPTIKRVCSHRVLAMFLTQNKGKIMKKKRDAQTHDRGFRIIEYAKKVFRNTHDPDLNKLLEHYHKGDINTSDFEEKLKMVFERLSVDPEGDS